ncbi:L,D-transpeptidase [Streptacidiphilus monticola]|uniref:Ig-like domain-containing protein n=1 Tax=Streptacidiphilus monticola TaxID=2161674 RepID=A0ABW1GC68_9ACTN
MRKSKGTVAGMALLACAVLAGATACNDSASAAAGSAASAGAASGTPSAGSGTASGTSSPSASASPSPTHPSGPPMQLESITPATGATVGVAMPVSVVFSHAVAASARAGVEQHLKVTTSVPTTGSWHWYPGGTRVDWRPENYWTPGTQVSVDADLTDVPDGNGRYGTHAYHHSFTIGADFETFVSVTGHSMVVKSDGKVVRTMPIDAGSPDFPSWDGTMAVIDKEPTVRMTSCSVGISCDKNSPNYYDLTLPWDVHLTYSGTYVHYSTGDPYPGHSYGSHGCVHLSLADSKWYYSHVKQGDPVTITGSPRGKAAPDNGYAAFNLSWAQWQAGSALNGQ